jgi:hypothetical protein
MKALLVRVGVDSGKQGGLWNAPARSNTRHFVYVPIAERARFRPGLATGYGDNRFGIQKALRKLGIGLPPHLASAGMHLDPDYRYLTYGDVRGRAQQIRKLGKGDLLVFYSSYSENGSPKSLIYALSGLYVVNCWKAASEISKKDWHKNAHTRIRPGSDQIVVFAKPIVSGRLRKYIPIGEYRNRAYRVRRDILKAWGGLSVKNGYIQRSRRLPKFCDPEKFYRWFKQQSVRLTPRNN